MTTSSDRGFATSMLIPLLAATGVGVRYQIANGVNIAMLIAVCLAPVWISCLPRYRWMWQLIALGTAAAAAGVVLTLADTTRESPTSLVIGQTLGLLTLVAIAGVLLWVRGEIGLPLMITAHGVGMVINALIGGLHEANPWKFSLAAPVAVLLLGLAALSRKPFAEVAALVLLGGVSFFADSRSLTAMLMLTVVLVIWQRRNLAEHRPRPWSTALLLGMVAAAVFQLMQSLILEGALGTAAQQRSQAQIDTTGSVLTGGRPELGAAVALILRQPWGYGSGVAPTANDVWIAKTGMSALNYDPDNGYVERYLFGNGFEVHSVLGDLWIRFGILGALFAIALVAYCLYATSARISTGSASAVLVLLTLQATWDLAFGPFLSASRGMGLVLALAALPLVAESGQDPGPGRRREWRPADGLAKVSPTNVRLLPDNPARRS
jgi:hypothetical protein